VSAPPIVNPSTFCRLLDEQCFPDLGFLEIVSAQYAPWADPDYLVHLTLRHQVTRQPVKQTLVVRNLGDNAETVFRAARELWARVFCRSETLGMALPLGTLPQKGLMLQVLPDGPSLADLLQDRRDSLFRTGVRTWARWLAKLHDAEQSCESLPIRLDSELRQELSNAQEQIRQACPSVKALLDSLVEDLHHTLSGSPNPLLPTIGSTDPARIRFQKEVLTPIDFHAAALGDPAADIGMACADLELAVLQATGSQETADRTVESFTSEYHRHGGAEPFVRFGPYRAYRHVMQIRDSLRDGAIDPQHIGRWLMRAQSFLTAATVH
jgi:hypothetical protein